MLRRERLQSTALVETEGLSLRDGSQPPWALMSAAPFLGLLGVACMVNGISSTGRGGKALEERALLQGCSQCGLTGWPIPGRTTTFWREPGARF